MSKNFNLAATLQNASVFNDLGQIQGKDSKMTNKFDSKDSFIRGYNFGRAQKRSLTNREIETNFPDVEVESFAQGMFDGIEGDRFRLDLTLGQLGIFQVDK